MIHSTHISHLFSGGVEKQKLERNDNAYSSQGACLQLNFQLPALKLTLQMLDSEAEI